MDSIPYECAIVIGIGCQPSLKTLLNTQASGIDLTPILPSIIPRLRH
jgi:hypothetical protein